MIVHVHYFYNKDLSFQADIDKERENLVNKKIKIIFCSCEFSCSQLCNKCL